jgi:uncharacterized protein DUF2845
MRAFASCAFAALLLALAVPASADGLRCGSRLVVQGDPRAKVRHYCGEPTDVQTHYIQRRPSFTAGGRFYSYGDGYVEIPVEIWTYNFGPYKLMRQIRFVDGFVDEIESLGYGYHETPSSSAESRSDRRETYR